MTLQTLLLIFPACDIEFINSCCIIVNKHYRCRIPRYGVLASCPRCPMPFYMMYDVMQTGHHLTCNSHQLEFDTTSPFILSLLSQLYHGAKHLKIPNTYRVLHIRKFNPQYMFLVKILLQMLISLYHTFIDAVCAVQPDKNIVQQFGTLAVFNKMVMEASHQAMSQQTCFPTSAKAPLGWVEQLLVANY